MIHNKLKDIKIVLASQSPRRVEILNLLGLKFLQFPSDYPEDHVENLSPSQLVRLHAKHKAQGVAKKMGKDCLVIGSDTIVYQHKQVLNKPQNLAQAYEFLQNLSNTYHTVYSGVAICYKGKTLLGYEKTKVYFDELSNDQISQYIDTGEPIDKAGAYGIQGYGSQFIKKIEGCYFNVMGFPVNKFRNMLTSLLGKE